MPMHNMYNLIEYIYSYPKSSGSLWQHCRDEPALNNNDEIVGFVDNTTANLF